MVAADPPDTSVHVSALCPGFTYSEFHDANGTREKISASTPPWLWLGADEVAAAGYEAVEANRAVAVPTSFLGAEGPKNVTMTAEIADGWLPLYYSPFRQDVYADYLKDAKPGFEVTAMANITITDDIEAGLYPVKAALGFYIGGMGAEGQNYHTKLASRMGLGDAALEIQRRFLAGDQAGAIDAVPASFADEIALVGPPERIKERLSVWRDSPVTTLLIHASDSHGLQTAAELVLEG